MSALLDALCHPDSEGWQIALALEAAKGLNHGKNWSFEMMFMVEWVESVSTWSRRTEGNDFPGLELCA